MMRRNPMHLFSGFALLVCVIAMLHASPATAEPSKASDEQLIEQLQRLAKTSEGIDDLSSAFKQRRYSPLLRKPIQSEGRIRSIKGLSRWDTSEPYESIMMVKPDRLELFDPEQNTLEVYPIEKRFGELLANPRPSPGDWLKQFDLQRAAPDMLSEQMQEDCAIDQQDDASFLLIRLTPKHEAMAEVVQELVIVLDVKTALSRGMAWTTGEQERTEIFFSKTEINQGLATKDLRFAVPDSARVVYPLGPLPESEKRSD